MSELRKVRAKIFVKTDNPYYSDEDKPKYVDHPQNEKLRISNKQQYYYKEVFIDGFFQAWGSDYEESDHGFGNYTVGIIEKLDGHIVTAMATDIQFIS